MTWHIGEDTIRQLLDAHELGKVQANSDHATAVLDQATNHLQSAHAARRHIPGPRQAVHNR